MKDLLGGYQELDGGLIVWFVLPDGTYYSVDNAFVDAKLSDQAHSPDLTAGQKITGALVVIKSTAHVSVSGLSTPRWSAFVSMTQCLLEQPRYRRWAHVRGERDSRLKSGQLVAILSG